MREVILNGTIIGRIDDDLTGMKISISGFDARMRDVEVGDLLMIASSINKTIGSSYKVTKTNYPNNVKDQFFIDMRWISKKELSET